MRQIIIISACTFLLGHKAEAQQTKKEYYDYNKTQLMAEYQVNGAGEKNGWFKGYDKSGVLVMEYNYINDQQNGTCKEYSTYNGRQLAKLETFKAGVLHGPYKLYGGPNGNLAITEGEYLNGEKNGKWTIYQGYTNYDLPKEVQAANEYYKTELFYEAGKQVFPDGTYTWTFYPSGKPYMTFTYLNGLKSGIHSYYLPDGKLSEEEKYDAGQVIYYKSFWSNGQLRSMNSSMGYEGYNMDGTPDSRMQDAAKAKEVAQKNLEYDQTLLEADSLLLSGAYTQAIEKYKSINYPVYLLESFEQLFTTYKDDGETVKWLEFEYSDLEDKYFSHASKGQMQYCKDVIAKEKK